MMPPNIFAIASVSIPLVPWSDRLGDPGDRTFDALKLLFDPQPSPILA
jgi:hypothetical protein